MPDDGDGGGYRRSRLWREYATAVCARNPLGLLHEHDEYDATVRRCESEV